MTWWEVLGTLCFLSLLAPAVVYVSAKWGAVGWFVGRRFYRRRYGARRRRLDDHEDLIIEEE